MATSCDLNAPRCTTEVLRVRLHGSQGGILVGHRPPPRPWSPPRYKWNTGVKQKFYICSDVTHTHKTHARPRPGQPWKARGRKKQTPTTGQRTKQRRGGEGNKRTSKTNVHGETDLTSTEHTPEPHDTLQRGTGDSGNKSGWLVGT